MNKIRILIVEDEWIVSEEIRSILEKYDYEIVGQADQVDDAEKILKSEHVDLVMLDINLKGTRDGIDLARIVHEKYGSEIIFLTAYYDEYFLKRASTVPHSAYLVKPFDERNLLATIQLAFIKQEVNDTLSYPEKQNHGLLLNDRIFVRDGSRFVKIEIDNILYFIAEGSYTEIFTTTTKITLSQNLKTLENKINNPQLVRVHRSYIVNLKKVEEIHGHQLKIQGQFIPISEAFKNELFEKLKFV